MKDRLYIMKFQWFLLGFALLFLTGCTTVQTTPASQDEAPSQPPNHQTRNHKSFTANFADLRKFVQSVAKEVSTSR
jgi:outer membrane biogenesis lipoprotein LolB